MKQDPSPKSRDVTRRSFLQTSTLAAAAAVAGGAGRVFGQEGGTIRVGLIGCGGRGLHDTKDLLNADPGVELVAMGDLFEARVKSTLGALRESAAGQVKVSPANCFAGWDACAQVLAAGVDHVVLTEPPHFRPAHLRLAVEAGKHVFMEKPVAVDPVGARSIIETSALAAEKGLTLVAGTQARRMTHRMELMKRIHDGAIGEIVAGQCFRSGDAMRGWGPRIEPGTVSDMEWQIRRWLFINWLSGDFVTEMHVHELDIVNWAMQAAPENVFANGGREVRVEPEFGNVFDHFAADMEYPNGARIAYLGNQIDGASGRTFERIVGTKGVAFTDWSRSFIAGENPYEYDGPAPNPTVQQHKDQIRAIREGLKLNEAKQIAESSLTAIMVRMSAYTGRAMSWNWLMNASTLDLSPPAYEWGDLPLDPVPVPGKTPLV